VFNVEDGKTIGGEKEKDVGIRGMETGDSGLVLQSRVRI
jgi:hypothetical protein